MMGTPSRPERGEVRYLVLDALKEGPSHGYEIIQTIERRSGGAYRPSPGSVYPTLQMLEEMDLVKSREDGSRRKYELTEAGTAELEAHREEVEDAYGRLGGAEPWAVADFRVLMRRVRRLMRTIGRAAHRGRMKQQELDAIAKTLDDAMDSIEKILGF